MSFGVVLVVVGAILRFATTVHTTGFNIHKIGDILLVVGIIVVLVAIYLISMGNRRTSTRETVVRDTPTGQERTERMDDRGTP